MQTFPVPEPNVSGLSCPFCHLLPWKLGLCPLLGTLASLSARWLQLCQSLTVRVFTSLEWFPPASPAVSCGPSSIPGEIVIPSHNLSLFPFCTFGAMSDLSSLALGDTRTPAPLHCPLIPLLYVPCLSQLVIPSGCLPLSASCLALRCWESRQDSSTGEVVQEGLWHKDGCHKNGMLFQRGRGDGWPRSWSTAVDVDVRPALG